VAHSRTGVVATIAATLGALWGAALTIGAFTLPVSTTQSFGPGLRHVRHSYTMVHGAGTQGALIALIPAVVGVIVWVALHRTCAHGSRWTRSLSKTIVWAGAALALLGAASIGMFVLPMVLLMGVSVSLVPTGKQPVGT
jgi:hypothetical protein